ncbi:Site-specific recombinase XerD [Saccharopolyspora antimicrobica]|uniref:Site-specific recombinase XerD n=1 Tax=Saccharopolyspora antimicrobica TaxID=455193 RepID=A0A1I4WWS3_9PSEU|nr:site-specific integrase [Saccharopolyspora antimicrobica]RKT84170.1 site-specific recombinase XerD [Saccharopolyspora antimicrobica]SFN17643.1 Site-specific recombinase XerD [Saccharopolyspora antimicrobica]
MGGRLPLSPGSSGEIKVKQVGGSFKARCRYRRTDGTYTDIRRLARTKELAKQAVRDAIKNIVAQSAGARLTSQDYFRTAAEMWLAQFKADAENGIYSFSSLDTYTDAYRNHVAKSLDNLRLFEIKAPVINALCQNKLKANSLSLAKHVKAVINGVMVFAIQEGAIETNPVREIAQLTERRAKTKRKKPRAMDASQLLAFFGKLDADEEAGEKDLPDLVRFVAATGERAGEALGAHWKDFDAEAKKLRMSGNLIQARGRGTVRNSGKSESADRDIPLADWCVEMLLERRAKLGKVDPESPIFTNTKGGYLNFQNLTNRVWLPFRKRAGYEWVTFHTLRKTFATLLDGAGMTAREIADLLGHSNPWTTYNTYMGRGLESRRSAEVLDSVVRLDADPKTGH